MIFHNTHFLRHWWNTTGRKSRLGGRCWQQWILNPARGIFQTVNSPTKWTHPSDGRINQARLTFSSCVKKPLLPLNQWTPSRRSCLGSPRLSLPLFTLSFKPIKLVVKSTVIPAWSEVWNVLRRQSEEVNCERFTFFYSKLKAQALQ